MPGVLWQQSVCSKASAPIWPLGVLWLLLCALPGAGLSGPCVRWSLPKEDLSLVLPVLLFCQPHVHPTSHR